jgi:hypothetical protein
MKRFRCWFGFHRYYWAQFNHTCELWVCECGRVIIQFAEEPRALSEVDKLNEWWKQAESPVSR